MLFTGESLAGCTITTQNTTSEWEKILDKKGTLCYYNQVCTRSLTDRMMASDAIDAGSIPAGCIFSLAKTVAVAVLRALNSNYMIR